jgi:hypothetical protein
MEATMTSAPLGPARQPWAPSAPARPTRPHLPAGVAIATVVLATLAMLGLLQWVFLLAASIMAIADGEEFSGWMLALGAGLVALDSFWLLLAVTTWRGHRWAWRTTLVLLGLVALLGLGVVVLGITTVGVSLAVLLAGLVFVGSGGLLLLLAGPRSSREYFGRR